MFLASTPFSIRFLSFFERNHVFILFSIFQHCYRYRQRIPTRRFLDSDEKKAGIDRQKNQVQKLIKRDQKATSAFDYLVINRRIGNCSVPTRGKEVIESGVGSGSGIDRGETPPRPSRSRLGGAVGLLCEPGAPEDADFFVNYAVP